ncbi:hypothetical protein DRQ15_03070 [candidate division KSB1 bacterium]|nr:MAG: hypothetical protein DRQ15_03070 [candidate division KSB1 bacterium]
MKKGRADLEIHDGATRLRWNFGMGLLHGVFFTGGMAFSNPSAVLPVFLNVFTRSRIAVGLLSTVMNISSVLPQLWVANKIETKVHKKPILVMALIVRALCWGFLGLITYLFSGSHPLTVVLALFFLLGIFSLMGGVAVVPFMDIWGKAIPPTLRGRFFGHRQLWGGLLAFGVGFVVKRILGNQRIAFPDNYALLFLFSFIFIAISYVALGSVKEPMEAVRKKPTAFRDFLRRTLHILRSNENYRTFLIVQILAGAGGIALPFYVLYAKNIIGVKAEMIGLFISAQMLGGTLSNLLWAYVSDYVGNKRVIQTAVFIASSMPLIALSASKGSQWLFVVVFVLMGFSTAGSSIGYTNFLLDIAPTGERPTYVSLNGTLTFPIMVYPLIGGVIANYLSYRSLFVVAMMLTLVGAILSMFLKEPRAQIGSTG